MDREQVRKQIQCQAMRQVDRHVKDPIWRRVGRQAGVSAEDRVGIQVFGGCVAVGWFQDRVGNQAQEDNDGNRV